MGTTVEDLVLRFSAETEKLSRDLKRVERDTERSGKRAAKSTDRINKSLKRVSASAKRAGAALIAAFAGGAALRGLRQTFSAMNDLQTAAEGLGVSVELIQELRFAFVAAGADAGKVVKVLTDFNKRIGEARSNLGTLLPFLKDFKISLDNADGTLKTSEQLFDEVADKIASLDDITARAALGNAAFGRAWVDVVAVLKDGSAALRDVRREARETGNVISSDLVAAAAEADAQFNVLLGTLAQNSRRMTIIFAQSLGIVELTTNQKIEALRKKALRLRRDLEERRGVLGPQSLGVRAAEIIEVETEMFKLQTTLKSLQAAAIDNNDTTNESSDAYKNLNHELNSLNIALSKVDKVGIFAIEEGLAEMDKLIGALDKKIINIGPDMGESIAIVADSFEEMIFNLSEADDAVKNLIASFGRLIIKQIALKAATSFVSVFGFADGGVMTGSGPAPLNRYAGGGVANSPQLAMFGEGSRPEAFVPLEDGRTIPVTVKGMGNNGQGGRVVVNQENHFMVDVQNTVRAELLQVAPLLIEATADAVEARQAGIHT